jgi:1-acyl-sn-glycerol-3-phosphate acyltransferase
MDHRIYNSKVLKPIFQMAKVIPIASKKENPELLEQAYEQINQTLDEGHLLCIFPEGAITYDGELTTFKKGIEHIIATRPVPVVPLALQGLWGSWFSRYKGKAMKGIPRHIPRVTLSAGEVISPEQVSADYLQARVAELRGVKQ